MFRLLFFLLTVAAFAEEPFIFEKTPGRLPKDVVPKRYAIRIEPDVEKATFTGRVEIEVEARKAVPSLTLNSLKLQITSATLDGAAITAKVDDGTQLLTLSGAEISAGAHKLTLEFSGKLTEQPQGLYLTRYQLPDGKWQKALVTQMEPSDARRMFPCWDEPVFRAVFQLTAVVPQKHTAISNMPTEGETALADGKREIVFGASPAMSSYLVAFASSELESIEDEVDGVKLRIFATPGKRAQMRVAMEATKQVLPFFNEYFGVKYPLPKLDQVAFPSVGAAGMENWGCIIYADTAMLHDEVSGAQSGREHVFDVVAHEIAHQWFGDLVTMAWWDNLWLNEGFASWMDTKVADHFHPEWKKWLRAAGGREGAMRLDARATTHPIQQSIANEAEALKAFDEITYQKGQAFLRMLETWLGEGKFRAGLRLYFSRHANSNTTTADLWAALEETSGQKVREMAAGWTEQPGFPVVKVSMAGEKSIELRQERFVIHQKNAAPLSWLIPVTVSPVGGVPQVVLVGKEPLRVNCDLPAVVNVGATAYCRVCYDTELWDSLKLRLAELAEADRLNVLHDTWALVQSDKLPLKRWLEVAEQLRNDPSPLIGGHLAGVLGTLDHLARGTKQRDAIRKWSRDFLAPRFARLGWNAKAGEDIATVNHRAELIRMLGVCGDAAIVAEAQMRAKSFLEGGSLSGDLRSVVLHLAGKYADAKMWERLHDRARKTSDTEQKQILYGALASAGDIALAKHSLQLSLTGELPSNPAARMVARVAGEGEHSELALAFAKEHLGELLALLSASAADDYVAHLFRHFSDAARAEELVAFTKANLPPDAARATAIAVDDILFSAEFKARVLPQFAAYEQTDGVTNQRGKPGKKTTKSQ